MLSLSNCIWANQDRNAQKQPVISGFVSDALSRKPVGGVTISVTSVKDKIEKTIITDAAGKFILPKLPAGEVTIILEKKGYKTYRKDKIVLKEGMQVKLNFDISNDMAPEENSLFHPLLRLMES